MLVYSIGDSKSVVLSGDDEVCSNDDTRMTVDLFTVWSNLCTICCGNTGRSCMVFADKQIAVFIR